MRSSGSWSQCMRKTKGAFHEPPLSRPAATLSPPCGERAGRGVPIWFMAPMRVQILEVPPAHEPPPLPPFGHPLPRGGGEGRGEGAVGWFKVARRAQSSGHSLLGGEGWGEGERFSNPIFGVGGGLKLARGKSSSRRRLRNPATRGRYGTSYPVFTSPPVFG